MIKNICGFKKLGSSGMFNIKKGFTLTQRLACSMVSRQCFSILWMGDKKLNLPRFDVLIEDIDEEDLRGDISKLLGKPYLSPLKEDEK